MCLLRSASLLIGHQAENDFIIVLMRREDAVWFGQSCVDAQQEYRVRFGGSRRPPEAIAGSSGQSEFCPIQREESFAILSNTSLNVLDSSSE